MFKFGIVLVPQDLNWSGWKKTFGPVFNPLILHGSADQLVEYVKSPAGKKLIAWLARHDVDLEFALHLCSQLVPRGLFRGNPELFRMDEQGQRTPDANFCPSNRNAVDVIAKSLKTYVKYLRPTTGRHHLWPDDNKPWCFCPRCKGLSFADQNVTFANLLARALRQMDDAARVSFLAYKPALKTPRIKGEPNVFLEFAPIERDYRLGLADRRSKVNMPMKCELTKLLKHFGKKDSQVLEYWLDVSRFSRWKRPAVKLDVPQRVVRSDLAFYSSLGFEYITTFGVWLDKAYVKAFGDSPLKSFMEAASKLQ